MSAPTKGWEIVLSKPIGSGDRVCQGGELRRHEEMARHLLQSGGNALVEGALAELIAHQVHVHSNQLDHVPAQDAKCCSDIGFIVKLPSSTGFQRWLGLSEQVRGCR